MRNKLVALICLLALALCSAPAWGQTLKDELGRTVQVPDQPRRIIALTPSLTEILFALKLGDKVKGATTWSDYPAQAKEVPRVGSYVSPNLEKIVSLAPDLVLANREGNPPWVVEKLEAGGVPVYVTRPDTPRALPDSLEKLGRICGAPQEGKRLAQSLRQSYAKAAGLLKGVKPLPTLLVVGSRPLVCAGPSSFNGKLMIMAGAENVAPGGIGAWPRLSLDYVVKKSPKLVIISTMERGQDLAREIKYWRNMPGLCGKPGYRVVHLVSDIIDRPGPRVGMGLEALAALVHPERMKAGAPKP